MTLLLSHCKYLCYTDGIRRQSINWNRLRAGKARTQKGVELNRAMALKSVPELPLFVDELPF